VNRPVHLNIHMYVYVFFKREHFICVDYIIQYVYIYYLYSRLKIPTYYMYANANVHKTDKTKMQTIRAQLYDTRTPANCILLIASVYEHLLMYTDNPLHYCIISKRFIGNGKNGKQKPTRMCVYNYCDRNTLN